MWNQNWYKHYIILGWIIGTAWALLCLFRSKIESNIIFGHGVESLVVFAWVRALYVCSTQQKKVSPKHNCIFFLYKTTTDLIWLWLKKSLQMCGCICQRNSHVIHLEQNPTCFNFKKRKYKADMYYRQRIRDFNLISQEHRKRNRNLIHCSVAGKGERGRETMSVREKV